MHRRLAARAVFVFISILTCSITLAQSPAGERKHEFTYDASKSTDKPSSVNLAGDFNGWSKDATPMKQIRPGVWSVTVDLTEGLHEYKFVLNGDKWITDPTGDKALEKDDNNGGKNSVIMIGGSAPAPTTTVPPDAANAPPSAPAAAAGSRKQEFTFDASNSTDKPTSVNLAGDFNGWSKDATPLKQVRPGVWSVTIDLTEGLHQYKFVLNGDKWISDPLAEKELEQDDNYGGKNSGVMVGADARKLPPPEPNKINGDAILFDPKSATDVSPMAGGFVRLRVRAQAKDIESIAATIGGGKTQTLHRLSEDRGFDLFGGVVQSPSSSGTGDLKLVFTDGTAKLNKDYQIGVAPKFDTPDWAKHAVWYQIFPERFRNGDKSNDPGDHKDYETLVGWTSKWWESQPGEAPGFENFYDGQGNVWKRRYGGDIQGLKEKLPYMRELGITAIYLNPMFEADSMHKYDTTDYRHIDDNFGARETIPLAGETEDPSTWKWSKSDKIFLDFVQEAHKQGFKVILDGVFNHMGRSSPFFQDVVKNGKKSKYASWFEITDFGSQTPADPKMFGKPGGMHFKAWDGDSGHLPVFKKDDKLGLVHGPREYVMGITKRWLAPDGDPSKGVDGWRLDVPGDIPMPFWLDWHKLVRSTKPDAYTSAEIWTWAQPWLNNGDQFNAVMNYQFATATQDFFVNVNKQIKPSQFNARCIDLEFNYPFQVAEVQMNLFDSHDTDRLASMFVNPDRVYDATNREQDNAKAMGYEKRKPNETEWARMRQDVAFQMTFLGAPMIYYGDEAGMWGPDDPSNRMPMVWKDLEPFEDPQVKFDAKQFAHYQHLIGVRTALPQLQTGFFRPLVIEDGKNVYAFAREIPNGASAYVVINRSDREQTVELPLDGSAKLIDWMSDASVKVDKSSDGRPVAKPQASAKTMSASNGKLTVKVQPYGTAILAESK